MVTLVFGILMTRVLSGHFSVHDYGTYSQVMLVTTTVSSLTILGMMDGINFFFCREEDENKRNAYISTIFLLQYVVSAIAATVILLCTVPLSRYFNNSDLKSLIIFAAILPVLSNSISMLQILFIAFGKARIIAIRNLVVSILKLIAIIIASYVFDNIGFLLLYQAAMDFAQVLYFRYTLSKNNCHIHVFQFDKSLIGEIFTYCIPMAMFTVIKSINRDCDKFVISFFADTETLAIYTNASKLLPFDIIMSSFCTVLLPYFTRYIVARKYDLTQNLYRSFLELSYICTSILAVGAIFTAPQLMEFLYTEKYLSGLPIFIIYTLVDVVSVLNLTMLLSAAGKTKTIMYASLGTFIANIVLNILCYLAFGLIGPAAATLIVTLVQGLIILYLSSREIKTSILKLFDWKYFSGFVVELIFMGIAVLAIRSKLEYLHLHYFLILCLCYGLFIGLLLLVNLKRIMSNVQAINSYKISNFNS